MAFTPSYHPFLGSLQTGSFVLENKPGSSLALLACTVGYCDFTFGCVAAHESLATSYFLSGSNLLVVISLLHNILSQKLSFSVMAPATFGILFSPNFLSIEFLPPLTQIHWTVSTHEKLRAEESIID